MKKILIAALMCLPMMCLAQNTWEMPKDAKTGKTIDAEAKYLVGAVPVVDGKVRFSATLEAPGKTAQQIYDLLLTYLTDMTTEEGQLEQSHIMRADKASFEIEAVYQEWLVFVNKPLNLDRTRFFYNIIVSCHNGKADVSLTNINYMYEEERDPQMYKAENSITDEYGLKKNKKALSRVYGKFRRKTIDRKDYIFGQLVELLKK